MRRSDLTKNWMIRTRLFLMAATWVGLGLFLVSGHAQAQEKVPGEVMKAQALREKGPNVLMVLVEGWSDALVSDENPNLVKLNGMSTAFLSAYPPCKSDNAGRTAVMTGTYPWANGVVTEVQDWRRALLLQKIPSLPELFRQGGFVTGGSGKVFARPKMVKVQKEMPVGYDLVAAWDERFFGVSDDKKTIDWAVKFVTRDHGVPFFCVVGLEGERDLDAGLGKLMDALEKGNRMADTVIVVMGVPRLATVGRVPLFIAVPGMTVGEKPVSASVSLVDVYPTLVEVVGDLELPPGVAGKSLVSLLKDANSVWDRPVLIASGLPEDRSIRVVDKNWSFDRYEKGEEELHDMSTVGSSLNNVPNAPEHAALEARLAALVPKDWAAYSRAMEKVDYDASADGAVVYWLQAGDEFAAESLPDVTGKGFDMELVFEYRALSDANGTLISAGDARMGFAVHLQDGKPSFTVNYDGLRTSLVAEKALEDGKVSLRALMGVDGSLDVGVTGRDAHGYAPMEGGFPRRLPGKLAVGQRSAVLPAKEFPKSAAFGGEISKVSFGLLPGVTEELRAAKATPVE
ncbi:hypothetical protein FEM03_16275 [Phragmitibacter flavus]|uniref:Laminin G domain-containing protein n=1 Tax=Phragmitibacter flavus TaxID=2576071 RepID=A0A5R8KC16_9BACT|nr:LamG domain-containing protein [Phragmitibacter flavus]TLD69873.1 hypothetical protein FEM03_16275 [Phragmitibacter flavus]